MKSHIELTLSNSVGSDEKYTFMMKIENILSVEKILTDRGMYSVKFLIRYPTEDDEDPGEFKEYIIDMRANFDTEEERDEYYEHIKRVLDAAPCDILYTPPKHE